MPSWQARCVGRVVEWGIRQAAGGDPERLLRRARRLLDAPNPLQWARVRGVRVEPIRRGPVQGEWVTAERSDRGVLLCLHGGGYVAGSPVTHRPITAALARLSGRRVLGLRYPLAPAHRFPAALDDAVTAYRWLLAEETPARALTLAGDSAGGGLLLAALVRARDDTLRVHHGRLQAAGGSSTLRVFDGLFHVWQLLDGLVPEARLALREAADFLNAQTATISTAS
jgi:acetyl esterase/lipase